MKGLKSHSLYRFQGTTFVGGAAMLYQYDDDNKNASIVSIENKKMSKQALDYIHTEISNALFI